MISNIVRISSLQSKNTTWEGVQKGYNECGDAPIALAPALPPILSTCPNTLHTPPLHTQHTPATVFTVFKTYCAIVHTYHNTSISLRGTVRHREIYCWLYNSKCRNDLGAASQLANQTETNGCDVAFWFFNSKTRLGSPLFCLCWKKWNCSNSQK